MSDPSETYYFAFDTHGDTMACHGVRFETIKVDARAHGSRKFKLLAAEYDKDDLRVKQLFVHCFDNMEKRNKKAMDAIRDADSLKETVACLAELMKRFPVALLHDVMANDVAASAIKDTVASRKKEAEILHAIADKIDASGVVLKTMREHLTELGKFSHALDQFAGFVDCMERLQKLQASGWLNHLKLFSTDEVPANASGPGTGLPKTEANSPSQPAADPPAGPL